MTDEYDPVKEHMQAFDNANADTIPAPPATSDPAEEVKAELARLRRRVQVLEAENRRLLTRTWHAMHQLRAALGETVRDPYSWMASMAL